MGLIVVESIASGVNGGGNPTLTITKPTGLTEGDLMVFVGSTGAGTTGDTHTINTPSGWTLVTSTQGGSSSAYIHFKIATSGDAAASNFSWTSSGGVFTIAGSILRCSNFDDTNTVEGSYANSTTTAAVDTLVNRSGTATVNVPNDLIVMAIGAADPGSGNSASVSGYTSTPSLTWTELYDEGGFTSNSCAAAAYAIYTGGSDDITNIQATLSHPFDNHSAAVAAFRSYYPSAGTNTLVTTTSSNFSQTGACDTLSSNVLVTSSAATNTQTGEGIAPQVWTTITKS